MSFLASFLFLFAFVKGKKPLDDDVSCDVCKEVVAQIDDFLLKNSTIQNIDILAQKICQAIILNDDCPPPYNSWQCQDVCYGVVHEYFKYPLSVVCIQSPSNNPFQGSPIFFGFLKYEPEVLFIATSYWFDPNRVCHFLNFGCPAPAPTILPTPPPEIITDNYERMNNSDEIGYFIQIPDLHWDPWYKEGTVVNCGEPVCCRELDNNHTYSDPIYSGPYGALADCDMPTSVLDAMFDYFNSEIKSKYNLIHKIFNYV